jgi:hypothetical protein
MDTTVETLFIRSFVQKERRERTQFELLSPKKRGAFLNKLCHTYNNVLDMRYAQAVSNEIEYPKMVVHHLKHHLAPKTVYVISTIDDIDGTLLPLEEAVERIFFHGLPSILLCIPDKLSYFQAEQVVGPPPRFVLKRP